MEVEKANIFELIFGLRHAAIKNMISDIYNYQPIGINLAQFNFGMYSIFILFLGPMIIAIIYDFIMRRKEHISSSQDLPLTLLPIRKQPILDEKNQPITSDKGKKAA